MKAEVVRASVSLRPFFHPQTHPTLLQPNQRSPAATSLVEHMEHAIALAALPLRCHSRRQSASRTTTTQRPVISTEARQPHRLAQRRVPQPQSSLSRSTPPSSTNLTHAKHAVILSVAWRGFSRQTQSKDPEEARPPQPSKPFQPQRSNQRHPSLTTDH